MIRFADAVVYLGSGLVGLLCILIILRRLERPFITPAWLWTFAWVVLYFWALIFGFPYKYSEMGVAVLIVASLAFPTGFYAGLYFLPNLSYGASVSKSAIRRMLKYSAYIQSATLLTGIVGASRFSSIFGGSIFTHHSASDIAAIAVANAGLLYSGEIDLPPSANVGFAILQIGFIMNAFSIAARGSSLLNGTLFVALLSVSVIWTAISTQRSYIGLSLVWWSASYLATNTLFGRGFTFRTKYWIRFIFFGIVLSCVFVLFQGLRLQEYRLENVGTILEHMRPWVAGTIPAFCKWLSDFSERYSTYGTYFFRPFSGLLGIHTIDRVEPYFIGAGQSSNATTIVRIFIQDFGVTGGLMFCVFLGSLSATAYRACRAGNIYGWILATAMYCMAFWSPNAWFFLYGSRIATFFLLLSLITLLSIRISKSTSRGPTRIPSEAL